MKTVYTAIIILLCTCTTYATTWEEPWQKDILENAEYFIKGKVISTNDTLITVEVLKNFGQKTTPHIINIDGFYMLKICSIAENDGVRFIAKTGETAYFFLKKTNTGSYQLPTPTSGFDHVVNDTVYATFRHTYHQAGITPMVYEMAYEVIWNKYRNLPYTADKLQAFVQEQLAKAPAGFSKDELPTFFKQHVALESVYLMGWEWSFDVLKKFTEFDNFHSRVSAIRAMGNLHTTQVKEYLFTYLQRDNVNNFTKVMAIWALGSMHDVQMVNRLFALRSTLSNNYEGFGGNIMDPRVCTYIPSPKEAVMELKEQTE